MAVDLISYIYERNLGECGCWQISMILLIFASKFAVGWHQLLVVIAQPRPAFTCKDTTIDKCSSDCPSHEFDKSLFEETVITKWDLVCKHEWLADHLQTFVMLGILVGNTGFGYLSDRFGRRIPLLIAIIMQIICGFLAAFAPWLWLYILLRCLTAVSTGGTMLIAFVLILELTVQKHRSLVGVLFQVPFQLGHASLGLIGYLCRHWQTQQLVVSVPQVLLISYCCFVPESPRWLLIMGRADDAIKVIERAAKCNWKPIDNVRTDVETNLANLTGNQAKGGNLLDLVRTPRMRMKTLCQCFNWFVISLTFFVMAKYIGIIFGNIFLNITIVGLIQLPGNVLAILLIDMWGRRNALAMSYVVYIIPSCLIDIMPEKPEWPSQTLACIGMMGTSMSFSIIYVYTGEMFPTVIRNLSMGILSMVACFGSMIAPYIGYLDKFGVWLPTLILAVFLFSSSLVTVKFLPETLKQKLPDTIEEANKL